MGAWYLVDTIIINCFQRALYNATEIQDTQAISREILYNFLATSIDSYYPGFDGYQ